MQCTLLNEDLIYGYAVTVLDNVTKLCSDFAKRSFAVILLVVWL